MNQIMITFTYHTSVQYSFVCQDENNVSQLISTCPTFLENLFKVDQPLDERMIERNRAKRIRLAGDLLTGTSPPIALEQRVSLAPRRPACELREAGN